MRCSSCGTELEETWFFCPICGARKGQEFGKGIEDLMELFERSFKGIFSGGLPANFPFGRGFMVEITQEGGNPKISVKEFGEAREEKKEDTTALGKKIPEGSKVIEPKVTLKGDEKIIEVYLPEVHSEKDIHIKKFHDSLEIRAYGDKKVYFAILPNVRAANLEQKFVNGILTIQLS